MEFYHGGGEDNHFHTINNPSQEVFGKIERDELIQLLNTFGLKRTHIQYGRKLNPVEKINGRLKLMVDDGGNDHTSAFWALHDNFQ
ncbi:predicted protein [Sclerotinia sclerotiorum 1980 UF-70]|uniref:Uncharacterized protein n=2 Tax=Sclerotinia sclerotiorum (strain ATCC 18683 / 1980 / Ss-1) TaxID=665079 RepID=A0A1D9PZG6_SCLS1|nr:predicted protein [Sclerotinia sclerotiorum 1980 UF-70]APA08077.1 hypothetical protein sscle_03g028470 [Sclerotinia sclerotiorum 1980 UF-70]EDN90868.1 predicted protein [Sclerotinia sclerotiorum 1980 UF-70]